MMETTIIRELIPHIDATYRTLDTRDGRAMMGGSMGGMGTLKLAFKYPELFSSAVAFCPAMLDAEANMERNPELIPALFHGDKTLFTKDSPAAMLVTNADNIRGRLAIKIIIGSEDGLLKWTEQLHASMVKLRISHELEIVGGVGHDFGTYIPPRPSICEHQLRAALRRRPFHYAAAVSIQHLFSLQVVPGVMSSCHGIEKRRNPFMHAKYTLAVVTAIFLGLFGPGRGVAGGDTSWLLEGKYGIFLHYQYRILLGYSIATEPQFPQPSEMSAEQWNQFVDGFDVKGFAEQMAQAKVGWVIFCIDDHYFAWPCAPNKTFSDFTGYAPGEKCSRRDLVMDLADALNAKGVKLICYFAGLNGYMKEPQVSAGLMDNDADRGGMNDKKPPAAECRRRRLAVLREYANRYKDKIAGWWFDGVEPDTYRAQPDDWWTINTIVHAANPRAVIAFSYGGNEQACVCEGIDDFTGGDTWSKQDLTRLTPVHLPAPQGVLWHGKIYCGNVYHGQGDACQFSDQELIDWVTTCNRQGGVCTLDWPLDPRTGLLKGFGIAQLKRLAQGVKKD